jgi:hypothetical protein
MEGMEVCTVRREVEEEEQEIVTRVEQEVMERLV